MKQNRLAPWFGADTMAAPNIAKLLGGRPWLGIPFGGGMSIVPEVTARSIVVNDIHSNIINLCRVLRHTDLRTTLIQRLNNTAFHPAELTDAQRLAAAFKPEKEDAWQGEPWPSLDHACAYFVSQWMGRSGNAGTKDEFKGKLSTRTNANGGDSCKRFRSAVEALDDWAAVMRFCNFSCLDFRAWFEQYGGDTDCHSYYVDPPWVEEGKRYLHPFTEQDHRDLAALVRRYTKARVVVRYGDHPLIRELYSGWTFSSAPTRNQGNNEVNEVLITREG